MEALIFHRNITKTLCPLDECNQFCHQFLQLQFQFQFQAVNLCSSSSRSIRKPFACLDPVQFQFYTLFLVLGLVPSCLLVQIQLQVSFQAQLVKKLSKPDGIRYFQSYVVCLKEHLTTVLEEFEGKTSTWLNRRVNLLQKHH